MDPNELYHHGIKGMKWGVRRTRAQLGYKTSSGKKRSSSTSNAREAVKNYLAKRKAKKTIEKEAAKAKNRSVSDMSDAELQSAINRKQLEQRYNQLYPKTESFASKFAKKALNDVLVPSATNAARNYLNGYLDKAVKNSLKDMDPNDKLKKEIAELNLKKQKAELDSFFEKNNDTTLKEMQKQVERMQVERQEAQLYDYFAKRNEKISGYLPAPKR